MEFFLYYVIPFVVVLGVLIFFHELGHFLAAKSFGVGVLKFSLGFGPKIAGKTVGETEYLISAFPLGGYVKLMGEDDDDEEEEAVSPADEERSFSNQHVLKRIIIVVAGPVFNILLALLIFIAFHMVVGAQVMVPEVGQVREDSPAYRAGLQKGDLIVYIGEKSIESWSQLKEVVQRCEGKPLEVVVKRNNQPLRVTLIPEESTVKNIFGEDIKSMLIGVVQSGRMNTVPVGPLGAVKLGFKRTWELTELTCVTVVKLFQRVIPIKTLGGPILIGQMTGDLAKENLSYLVPFTAVISINLGILNLLPIPILDGGLIVFLLIELITRRPINLKVRETAQKVGLALLLLLMVVVVYNDIARLLE
jgi:regulator of sigma E protease